MCAFPSLASLYSNSEHVYVVQLDVLAVWRFILEIGTSLFLRFIIVFLNVKFEGNYLFYVSLIFDQFLRSCFGDFVKMRIP